MSSVIVHNPRTSLSLQTQFFKMWPPDCPMIRLGALLRFASLILTILIFRMVKALKMNMLGMQLILLDILNIITLFPSCMTFFIEKIVQQVL